MAPRSKGGVLMSNKKPQRYLSNAEIIEPPQQTEGAPSGTALKNGWAYDRSQKAFGQDNCPEDEILAGQERNNRSGITSTV